METRDTFKRNFTFVEPLYKKSKTRDQSDNEKKIASFDRKVKLCGDDFNVKTVVSHSGVNVTNLKRKIIKEYKVILPGACEKSIVVKDVERFKENDLNTNHRKARKQGWIYTNSELVNKKMLGNSNNYGNEVNNIGTNKITDIGKNENIIVHQIPDTWLRVYPAPKLPDETIFSVLVRCFLCQLGLATFLVIWTTIAVFTVQSFEGPQETKISVEFENEQNQLVIDLATELRQITPLSPRWRDAIERRIEDERQLTMYAVGEGVRIKPGQFWNLSGTFLFAIYVMTALGFGAPVPHTVWGRTSALIYAILAIPTHIYLMVNLSTCVIARSEAYAKYFRGNFCKHAKSDSDSQRECPNHSRNSELLKSNSNVHKHMKRCIRLFTAVHCMPFATVSYYIMGVISFGVLRDKTLSETVMFPLEFTTTGGLERVETYVRVLYGFYVEGAMCLLACILATLRRHSNSTIASLSKTYRLFETDACTDCINISRERV